MVEIEQPQETTKSIDAQFKVVLVGKSNSGKSCLFYRFIAKDFSETDASVSLDLGMRIMRLGDGKRVGLNLWDIPGNQNYW